jgi:hypothetical protein
VCFRFYFFIFFYLFIYLFIYLFWGGGSSLLGQSFFTVSLQGAMGIQISFTSGKMRIKSGIMRPGKLAHVNRKKSYKLFNRKAKRQYELFDVNKYNSQRKQRRCCKEKENVVRGHGCYSSGNVVRRFCGASSLTALPQHVGSTSFKPL